MRLIGILALAFLLTSCTQFTTRTGDCTTADGEVIWVFYNELPINNEWTKCIYCGAGIAEADLYDFVHDRYASYPEDRSYLLEELEERYSNAQAEGTDINESLTPCFYTYDWNDYDNDTQTGCEQIVCSDNPTINDMVRRNHGAWRVSRSIVNMHYD